MGKWTVSGQVAVIILDSIKRNITKVYRGSMDCLMCRAVSWIPHVVREAVADGADSLEQRGSSVGSDADTDTFQALLIKYELCLLPK